MARLTGSKMGLAASCLYWARDDVPVPPRESSEAADAGTRKHGIIEALISSWAMDFNLSAANWGSESYEAFMAVVANLNEWLPRGGRCEAPFAYDPQTGRGYSLATNGGHRDYSLVKPGEIALTVDWYDVSDGIVHIWDWKFGRQTETEPAETNPQLATAALAICRAYGCTSAKVGLAFVDDDGTARVSVATLDAFDLERISGEVRGIWERLQSDPMPNPGPWCRAKWCPLRATCPATTAALATTPAAPLSLTISTPEQAARVHTQLALAEEFLAGVKRALNDYVKANGAVPLGDGSSLAVVEVSRETVQATPAVKAALDREGLSEALEWSTSKAAIERCVKKSAPRGKAAERMREVLEVLQATGGVKVSTFEKVDVVKAKKGRAA